MPGAPSYPQISKQKQYSASTRGSLSVVKHLEAEPFHDIALASKP
jgi:hypothetical protein